MRTLLILALTLLATACTANPKEPISWTPDPDESYRYAVAERWGDEWREPELSHKADHLCPLDEIYRPPVTALRIEDRKTGKVRTVDCADS